MRRETNKHDNAFLPPTAHGEFPMTKRELFAAMAMQGYTSAGSTGMPCAKDLANYAVELADALINALNEDQ